MQIVRSLIFLLIVLSLSWIAGRPGFASLLWTYASRANRLDAANSAVSLSPADAEAHYVRGAILETSNELSAANAEYAEAVLLRPDDYVFWLSLAHTRELNNDQEGATAAANRAVQL